RERYELTDCEWFAIKPLLPNKPRGVPRVDDRSVLNGIFWVLRSGAPWRDLPRSLGPYTTERPSRFGVAYSSDRHAPRPIKSIRLCGVRDVLGVIPTPWQETFLRAQRGASILPFATTMPTEASKAPT